MDDGLYFYLSKLYNNDKKTSQRLFAIKHSRRILTNWKRVGLYSRVGFIPIVHTSGTEAVIQVFSTDPLIRNRVTPV